MIILGPMIKFFILLLKYSNVDAMTVLGVVKLENTHTETHSHTALHNVYFVSSKKYFVPHCTTRKHREKISWSHINTLPKGIFKV